MTLWILAPLTFFTAFLIDVCWAKYTIAASRHQRWPAAWWSALLGALGAVTFEAYSTSRWLMAVSIAGYFLGTAYAVKPEKQT